MEINELNFNKQCGHNSAFPLYIGEDPPTWGWDQVSLPRRDPPFLDGWFGARPEPYPKALRPTFALNLSFHEAKCFLLGRRGRGTPFFFYLILFPWLGEGSLGGLYLIRGVIYGCAGVYAVAYGVWVAHLWCVRMHLDSSGCVRTRSDAFGCVWVLMDAYGWRESGD